MCRGGWAVRAVTWEVMEAWSDGEAMMLGNQPKGLALEPDLETDRDIAVGVGYEQLEAKGCKGEVTPFRPQPPPFRPRAVCDLFPYKYTALGKTLPKLHQKEREKEIDD
ncbi:hypothetical protein F2Q69_00053535 [Brassica cretica]|uniref:Uncharacterized protein n=1 Tax=Brassica cretica TaxID=69181 RepID=A0A8S9N157_BRACR|nr:hypothetical protein F2Q69_00053535 [Brassica cretica]